MFKPFFILFALLATGYYCKSRNVLDQPALNGIAGLLVHVAMPALILSSLIRQDIRENELRAFFVMTLLSIAFYLLFAMLSLIYIRIARIERKHSGMIQLSMISSNNGFMGYPVTYAFFGQAGMLMMIANNLALNIVQWTYGLHALRRGNIDEGEIKARGSRRKALRQIFNINIVAILIGLSFSLTGIFHWIPDFLDEFLAIAGGLATPLSMIYIGAMLHGAGWKDLLKNRLVSEPTLIRLSVFAAIAFALLWLLPLPPMMKKVGFLVAVLPSAAITPVMTAKYGSGADIATRIVVLSTLCSLVTTPLGILLANAVF